MIAKSEKMKMKKKISTPPPSPLPTTNVFVFSIPCPVFWEFHPSPFRKEGNVVSIYYKKNSDAGFSTTWMRQLF